MVHAHHPTHVHVILDTLEQFAQLQFVRPDVVMELALRRIAVFVQRDGKELIVEPRFVVLAAVATDPVSRRKHVIVILVFMEMPAKFILVKLLCIQA